jgi:hypothetical protein
MRHTAAVRISLTALFVGLCFTVARAQVLVAPEPGNRISISVSFTTTFNAASGLYTYTYSVTNSASSTQEAWLFALDLSGDAAETVTNPISPNGWTFMKHPMGPMVSWAATEVDAVPIGFVDDGSILPSPHQIKPGQTFGGFSFQSPRPPVTVKYYAQGFTQLPQAVDEGDLLESGAPKDFTHDSIVGIAQGPSPTDPSIQPSSLGFFNFVGLSNEAVRKTPVSVGVHFNQLAGTIDVTSFHAALNGQNVTTAFTPTGIGSDLNATLNQSSSPLLDGENVLEAVVSGVPHGSTETRFDLNHLNFYVNTTRPLDLNGDGVINCADLAIIKASFGRKTGQPGFDPRADVNGDGVVNVLDLSAVARQLPVGTTCD